MPKEDSEKPRSQATKEAPLESRRATPGELLVAELSSIMAREGKCLGATVCARSLFPDLPEQRIAKA